MALTTNTATVSFPCGNARAWEIPVTNADGSPADLTGWTAEWTLGIPENPVSLGLGIGSYVAPQICVLKATGANLDIVTINGASSLRFDLAYADTIGLTPRPYWQEAVAIDPQGNPYTVREGKVNLTPSLRALHLSAADPIPLSLPAEDSFAVWQGDDTPPKVWSFGPAGAPADLTGSAFMLTVTGAATIISALSGDPGSALSIDIPTGTVSWNYTKVQSLGIPGSGATYQLHRLIAGTTQLWAHGSVVGLIP
jgi:hypothetical protein